MTNKSIVIVSFLIKYDLPIFSKRHILNCCHMSNAIITNNVKINATLIFIAALTKNPIAIRRKYVNFCKTNIIAINDKKVEIKSVDI